MKNKTFITFGSAHYSQELGSLGGYYFIGSREEIFSIRGSNWAFENPIEKLQEFISRYNLREATAEQLTPVTEDAVTRRAYPWEARSHKIFFEGGEARAGEVEVKLPKIFVWLILDNPQWIQSYAMAEDGAGLCSHVSSSPSFAMTDIGYGGDTAIGDGKHKVYAKKYPDGYELHFLPQSLLDNPSFEEIEPEAAAAYKANRAGVTTKSAIVDASGENYES